VVKLKDMWLDIGAKDKPRPRASYLSAIRSHCNLGFQEMRNNYANAPAMDDKTGLWVCIEALRRASQKKLNCALYRFRPCRKKSACAARKRAPTESIRSGNCVDVDHATDLPDDRQKTGRGCCPGKGPVICRGPNMNPRVVERLIETAKANEIPYQLAADGRATGTDANPIQISRAGVAAGLVGIPNRYMHSAVEMVSLDDIDRAADLLANFATSLSGNDDFTP